MNSENYLFFLNHTQVVIREEISLKWHKWNHNVFFKSLILYLEQLWHKFLHVNLIYNLPTVHKLLIAESWLRFSATFFKHFAWKATINAQFEKQNW